MSDGQATVASSVPSASDLTNGNGYSAGVMDSATVSGTSDGARKDVSAPADASKPHQNGDSSSASQTNNNNKTASSSVDDDSERARALRNSHATKGNDDRWLASRVFVGNLPSDLQTDAGDLYDKFRKHGPIKGISVHGRFSFIQFEQDADAERAAKAEAGALMRGSTLEVRLAKEGRRGREDRDRDRDRGGDGSRRSRGESNGMSGSDRGGGRRRDDGGSRPSGRRSRSRSRSPRRLPQRRRSRSPLRSDRGGRRDDVLPLDTAAVLAATGAVPLAAVSLKPPGQPNDVEIIVVRRDLADYAAFVERRCKDCNLHVDIIFLHDDAEYEDAVRDLGNRGTSCVLLIMPRHRERRAVTLYRFDRQGAQPDEQKAVPLQDALTMIIQFFKRYKPATLRQRELEARGPGFFPQAQVADIEWALRALADRRFVPSLYVDHVIAYLTQVRQVAATSEGGLVDVLGVPTAAAGVPSVVGASMLAGGYGAVPAIPPVAAAPPAAVAAVPGLDNATLHKLLQLAQSAGIAGNGASSTNNNATTAAASAPSHLHQQSYQPQPQQQQQQQPQHSTHDIQRALDSLYTPRTGGGGPAGTAGQRESSAYDSYRSAATNAEQAARGGVGNGSVKYEPQQSAAVVNKYDLYGRNAGAHTLGSGAPTQSTAGGAMANAARYGGATSAYSAGLGGQQSMKEDMYGSGGARSGGGYGTSAGSGAGGYGADAHDVYVDRYGQTHSTSAGGGVGAGGYGVDKYEDKSQLQQQGGNARGGAPQQQGAYGQQSNMNPAGGVSAGGYGGFRY